MLLWVHKLRMPEMPYLERGIAEKMSCGLVANFPKGHLPVPRMAKLVGPTLFRSFVSKGLVPQCRCFCLGTCKTAKQTTNLTGPSPPIPDIWFCHWEMASHEILVGSDSTTINNLGTYCDIYIYIANVKVWDALFRMGSLGLRSHSSHNGAMCKIFRMLGCWPVSSQLFHAIAMPASRWDLTSWCQIKFKLSEMRCTLAW